jgi:hypothetical protein
MLKERPAPVPIVPATAVAAAAPTAEPTAAPTAPQTAVLTTNEHNVFTNLPPGFSINLLVPFISLMYSLVTSWALLFSPTSFIHFL